MKEEKKSVWVWTGRIFPWRLWLPDCDNCESEQAEKKRGEKNPIPCLYLQSGGLVFQPAVYTLRKRLHFPQEAPWEPQEDETSVEEQGENDKAKLGRGFCVKYKNQQSLLCKINK